MNSVLVDKLAKVLRVMTLTDVEKDQMRALDPRNRELLDHVESCSLKGVFSAGL